MKSWNEYTDEEKKNMPPLDPVYIENDLTSNVVWTGTEWLYIPMD